MSYFTKQQEAKAVDLILKECNFCPRCEHGDSNKNGGESSSETSMAYTERDKNGYVVALVDLGLHKAAAPARIDGENTKNGTATRLSAAVGIPSTTRHWRMPPAIGYLMHLEKLTVYHCKGLPREIFHLADSLQEIAFHFCDELDFEKDLPQMEFQSLHQLTDFRIHGRTASSSREATRILPIPTLRNLPNLRYLYYRGPNYDYSNEDHDSSCGSNDRYERDVSNCHLVQDLLHPEVRFKNSLEILEIERGNLMEVTVADLVSKVLPHYPKLQRLVLPNNQIESLAPILAKQPLAIPPSVRLRCLNLLGNPVLDSNNNRNDDSKSGSMRNNDATEMRVRRQLRFERTNLLRLLSLHQDITSLGHGITESALCTTEILLALDWNDGGAVLLSERFRPIPLSVWPVVLERVNQRKGYYDSSNVLYHLLRRGPVLEIQERRNDHPATHDDDDVESDRYAATLLAMVPPSWTTAVASSAASVFRVPFYSIDTPTDTTTTQTRKRKVSMP